jgi:simple sugar transport system ATP-binding protein
VPLLETRGVTKRFGHVEALRGADFAVHAGEVVALVGDNGAGKSTLVKVCAGVVQPDQGDIVFDGERVTIPDPTTARERGIEVVYQDLALAPDLDPAANLFLGRETIRSGILGKLGFLDNNAMASRTRDAFGELAAAVQNYQQPVGSLSGGQRQTIAVGRAATWAERIVFMDEPTASLGVEPSRKVLDLIRRVRDTGIGVVLVTHNMPQVFEIADRIEVMRLGRRNARFTTGEVTTEEVVAAMTGALETEGEPA